MLQSPINLYDEDTPFRVSIPEDLVSPVLSDYSLSSSSVGTSSRPSSSSNESSHIRSSKPATSNSQISSAQFPSRHATPTRQISPTESPRRAAPSSNRHASGERIIWGNIRPGGFDPKTGSGFKSSPKSRVLGFGNSDYGYGSVINTRKNAIEKTVQSGDNALNKGLYNDALQEYDKVVRVRPNNVNWRIVRADTLARLGRFEEALMDYYAAHQLDPENGRLHHRMSLFQLRLGVVDIAERHMIWASPECKRDLSAKIEKVKGHLIKGGNARKDDNWMAALREVDAIIAEGVDSCQSILAFRAEMLLRLDRLDQAEETICKALALESKLPTLVKFLGMLPEAYICAVHAQIEMALGRFENAVSAADKAHKLDQFNAEVSAIQTHVRMTSVARIKGNKSYIEGQYLEACDEYKVGLKYARSNASLLSNLAACHWKLGRWEKCIEICNQVLQIRPDNTKALLRRANSYAKLEKWAECASDYEAAVKIFPGDAKLTEALRNAQVALKKSQVENVARMITGSEVKEITAPKQFQEAISVSGDSIAFFHYRTNHRCIDLTPYVDALCNTYPSVNVIKVDIRECPSIADAENVHLVPSFVIYRKGYKMTEMVGPTRKELASWLEHYI